MEHSQNILNNDAPKEVTNVTAVVIFVGIIVVMLFAISYAFLS